MWSTNMPGWLGSRVVSVLDSGAEGPMVQIAVPLFTKQQNW